MDLGLNGRAAIVGGASRGLGLATARALAGEGARVLLCARDAGRLRAAEQALHRAVPGADTATLSCDLTLPDTGSRIADAALERFGRIDVLVTNTGGPPPGQPTALAEDAFSLAHEQNFMNVVRLARACVPAMRQRGWGRIINILALSIRQVEDNLTLSATSRAAVAAFSKYLSDEVAAAGITVNSILPGSILTERMREVAEMQARHLGRDPAAALDARRARIPAGRLGEPEEVGDLIAFLASERAAFLTGLLIPVDGGQLRCVL